MIEDLDPHFEHLRFMAPLSEGRAERLVQFLVANQPSVVLDLGCGWAELLLRVLAASPDSSGIGIDTDPDNLEHARRLADERALGNRVTLRNGDARALATGPVDAVICIGASQIWGSAVEDNEPLDYSSALEGLRSMVAAGARVVYGDGIWSSPPTAEAVAPLSGRLDEFIPLAALVELAIEHGFMPVAVHEANLDEWDEFESGYNARYACWLATHDAEGPTAQDVRTRAARQRASYFSGYRGVLGMAYLELLAV